MGTGRGKDTVAWTRLATLFAVVGLLFTAGVVKYHLLAFLLKGEDKKKKEATRTGSSVLSFFIHSFLTLPGPSPQEG